MNNKRLMENGPYLSLGHVQALRKRAEMANSDVLQVLFKAHPPAVQLSLLLKFCLNIPDQNALQKL